MDLIQLNYNTFVPERLIDGYNSLIWTERYRDASDFELKTNDVEGARIYYPEDTLLTHRETREVMIVETHEIGVDDEGMPEVTVKGRGFETFLENRVFEFAEPYEKWRMQQLYSPENAALCLIWNSVVNTTGDDVTGVNTGKSIQDVIPLVAVSDSSPAQQSTRAWWLNGGKHHYDHLLSFLAIGNLGVRSIRPPTALAKVTGFGPTGGVIKANLEVLNHLLIDVRNGVNRTEEQSVVDPIIFSHQTDHIDKPSYVYSHRGWRERVRSGVGWTFGDGYSAGNSGRSKRMAVSGSVEQGNLTLNEWYEVNNQKADEIMANSRRVALFDGEVSDTTPYEYKDDYDLGDYVTLIGQYGFRTTAQVLEYIRVEDQDGDRGYPTLGVVARTGG